MRLIAAILVLSAGAASAAADLPAPIAQFAAENAALCADMGGTPTVGPAFATEIDLNGDGAPDYVVDLAGIECANAWSAFCGSAGCPLSVWISRPEGFVKEWSDYAQAWSAAPAGEGSGILVEQQGGVCGKADPTKTCPSRLTFPANDSAAAAAAPAEPAAPSDGGAEATTGAAGPAATPPGALNAPTDDGWTLRTTEDGSRVAVTVGPGEIGVVAAFCLGGQPWLAANLKEPRTMAGAQFEFGFSASTVSTTAQQEQGAGGALIVELADKSLAQMLAGNDSATTVALDGKPQGRLSLKGSTKAIRAALKDCLAF